MCLCGLSCGVVWHVVVHVLLLFVCVVCLWFSVRCCLVRVVLLVFFVCVWCVFVVFNLNVRVVLVMYCVMLYGLSLRVLCVGVSFNAFVCSFLI